MGQPFHRCTESVTQSQQSDPQTDTCYTWTTTVFDFALKYTQSDLEYDDGLYGQYDGDGDWRRDESMSTPGTSRLPPQLQAENSAIQQEQRDNAKKNLTQPGEFVQIIYCTVCVTIQSVP